MESREKNDSDTTSSMPLQCVQWSKKHVEMILRSGTQKLLRIRSDGRSDGRSASVIV